MDTEPGIDAARHATVQVYDRGAQPGKEHRGQGLLLALESQQTVVLTCHHVIAPVAKENLCVRVREANDQLSDPIPVQYDEQRSQPGRDVVVLHIDRARVSARPQPLLIALNPKTYAGSLPATGLTYMEPESFDARVGATTRLKIPVDIPGNWPNPPTHYILPTVYRLVDPTDARPGISGGVVLCENGVLGLVHFSRGAAANQQREAYLVPLTTWAEGWPALTVLLEPIIDPRLLDVATVKKACDLEIPIDICIENYQQSCYFERKVQQAGQAALENHHGVIIVGKPKSGKTRLAWQLLQQRPEALVVIPHRDLPPEHIEPLGLAGKEVFLFFDDLHQNVLSRDPLEWQRCLTRTTGQQDCLLMCTSRDGEDWEKVREQPRLAALLQQLDHVFTSKVKDKGKDKGEDLSRDEGWQLACRLGIHRQDFEGRFDGTPGSLLLELGDMSVRYEYLCRKWKGDVSLSRLLDSAKILHSAHQPRLSLKVIRAVAEHIRGKTEMDAETWEALERRTEEEGFGQCDAEADEFRTYRPYLEECVAYQPGFEEIEALMPLLKRKKDYLGLVYLSATLMEDHQKTQEAEDICRVVITEGEILASDAAYFLLGNLLSKQPGRETEAEQAYRKAIQEGYTIASNNLGVLLSKQPGRETEAKEAFQQAKQVGISVTEGGNSWPGKDDLRKLVKKPKFVSIDNDVGFKNLPNKGCWVYDELLRGLANTGWVRFAPGFKSALYGHEGSDWCIKVLGMGVGENPSYFCERGYYLEHERKMLEAFKSKGFNFQPEPMSQEKTIEFLIKQCGLSPQQAQWRTERHDVLVMRYIRGFPFAVQTGYNLDYDLYISVIDNSVLQEMSVALKVLREQLHMAHGKRLLHNDVMPPNIIFTFDETDTIVAKLVDFELAQDLDAQSPDFVNNSVRELYQLRNVPRDDRGEHTKNLDDHLIDESTRVLDNLIQPVSSRENLGTVVISFLRRIHMIINSDKSYNYWENLLK